MLITAAILLMGVLVVVLVERSGSSSTTIGLDDGVAYSSDAVIGFDGARLLPVEAALGFGLAWLGTLLIAGLAGARSPLRHRARHRRLVLGGAGLLVVVGIALVLAAHGPAQTGWYAHAPLSDSTSPTSGLLLIRPSSIVAWVAVWAGTLLLAAGIGWTASRRRQAPDGATD